MDYAFARRLTLPMHRQDTRVHIGPVRMHSSTDNVSFRDSPALVRQESGYIAAILAKMAGGQPFQPSTMAGAQSVQPSSGAWLVIIRWQPSAYPATRTNGCALAAPGLVGRLPLAAIELSPAMALEDGCNLCAPAIVDG